MATKKKMTPSERAAEAGMDNQTKAYDRADNRDKDTKRNWSGRGTSGDEVAAKENVETNRKFKNEILGVLRGQGNDVANAERYGRDAYKSRGFGQGKKKNPENKGSLNYAKGGKVGGRGDGVATKGKTKGRMC